MGLILLYTGLSSLARLSLLIWWLSLSNMKLNLIMGVRMNRAKCLCAVLVLGFGFLAVSAGSAHAETIIRAVYRISLTDPEGGKTYQTDRLSIRSWTSMERCEIDGSKFSGFHTSAVEGFGITTAQGSPLEVKMDSIDCVLIRE